MAWFSGMEISLKLRVYLDTSVFSVCLDDSDASRQSVTQEFWGRLSEFEATTSVLTQRELSQTPHQEVRRRLLNLLDGLMIHQVTDEMYDLARQYVAYGVFTRAMLDDATHVAVAVLARQDLLVSWNFRHLVNRRRRALVNQMNISLGLPQIDIVAPPEV